MWRFLRNRQLILRLYTTGISVYGRASATVKFAKLVYKNTEIMIAPSQNLPVEAELFDIAGCLLVMAAIYYNCIGLAFWLVYNWCIRL